jgi:hypothetical protein
MKAPVWALIDRIPASLGLVAGSTGYHRYKLIDAAITNLDQWWLTGASLYQIESWGTDLHDVTNQYIAIGVTCGLVGTILLIAVLMLAFRTIGQCLRLNNQALERQRYAWGFGALLLAHTGSFLSTTYFSGFWFFFELSLALVASFYVQSQRAAEALMLEAGQGGADEASASRGTYAYP